jgi:stearoyl-CoA desaturase (delta-9 desaturase)
MKKQKPESEAVSSSSLYDSVIAMFDGHKAQPARNPEGLDWLRITPYLVLHLMCIGVIWVGWSWIAVVTAVLLYVIRMFAITAFYHRYFSHRTFKTSRVMQFIFAVIGASAIQRGPLWWASHHRLHHARSDQPDDSHSPTQHRFLYSHTGWFLKNKNYLPQLDRVSDLKKYPELVFIDRFDYLVPVLYFAALYGIGEWFAAYQPGFATNGMQMLIWGAISTVVLYHVTFTINSLAHRYGSRSYETRDNSRNNFVLALLTLGEGWHNNHHYYPSSVRQGFRWWQIDITFYVLKSMSIVGLVWDLRPVPREVIAAASGSSHTKGGEA